MFCYACSNEFDPSYEECPYCGANADGFFEYDSEHDSSEDYATTYECENCGQSVQIGESECPSCGHYEDIPF